MVARIHLASYLPLSLSYLFHSEVKKPWWSTIYIKNLLKPLSTPLQSRLSEYQACSSFHRYPLLISQVLLISSWTCRSYSFTQQSKIVGLTANSTEHESLWNPNHVFNTIYPARYIFVERNRPQEKTSRSVCVCLLCICACMCKVLYSVLVFIH